MNSGEIHGQIWRRSGRNIVDDVVHDGRDDDGRDSSLVWTTRIRWGVSIISRRKFAALKSRKIGIVNEYWSVCNEQYSLIVTHAYDFSTHQSYYWKFTVIIFCNVQEGLLRNKKRKRFENMFPDTWVISLYYTCTFLNIDLLDWYCIAISWHSITEYAIGMNFICRLHIKFIPITYCM